MIQAITGHNPSYKLQPSIKFIDMRKSASKGNEAKLNQSKAMRPKSPLKYIAQED